jgi:hypothetical protein
MAKKRGSRKGSRRTIGAREDAKAATSEAAAIAQRDMPGWQPVAPSGPVRSFGTARGSDADASQYRPAVDAVMPSTKELQRKFFGDAAAGMDAATVPDKELGDNVEVVEMKSGDLRKSVGVNRRSKKVEWSQG